MTEEITEMLMLFVQFSVKDSWNTFSRLTSQISNCLFLEDNRTLTFINR